jgi:hypothetical protein
VNELEERRIIRLLDGVAVEPLTPEDVSELLHSATLGVAARRRSRLQPRRVLATGAAAALILGTALASGLAGSQSPSSGPATGSAHLASFPEGSALHLLLSAGRGDGPS